MARSPDNPATAQQPLSKTARKRQAQQLQALGKNLAALTAEQLALLHLPEQLHQALTDYQRFKSREAKRRQLQYIGRIMRNEDSAAIASQLHTLQGRSASAQYQFQKLEDWRTALLTDNQAITQFVAAYPGVDRQQLRHLVKAARRAAEATDSATESTSTSASRALFRFLRDTTQDT